MGCWALEARFGAAVYKGCGYYFRELKLSLFWEVNEKSRKRLRRGRPNTACVFMFSHLGFCVLVQVRSSCSLDLCRNLYSSFSWLLWSIKIVDWELFRRLRLHWHLLDLGCTSLPYFCWGSFVGTEINLSLLFAERCLWSSIYTYINFLCWTLSLSASIIASLLRIISSCYILAIGRRIQSGQSRDSMPVWLPSSRLLNLHLCTPSISNNKHAAVVCLITFA